MLLHYIKFVTNTQLRTLKINVFSSGAMYKLKAHTNINLTYQCEPSIVIL